MRYVITKYWKLYYADVNIKHSKAHLLFHNDTHNHKITGILKQLKIPRSLHRVPHTRTTGWYAAMTLATS
jgi:hypothetical protein